MTIRGCWPLLAAAALSAGCADFVGGTGERPEGFRLVQGTLLVPEEDLLGRQVTGLQIAGLAIGTADDPAEIDLYGSDVFDASRSSGAPFVAPVHGRRTFFLILQVPSASGRGAGSFLGLLTFAGITAEASLIPPGEGDIDLGPVTVVPGEVRPAGNRLKVGDAHHPLSQIDTDSDATADLADPDDDDDSTPDATDDDNGNDGVPDLQQTLDALVDGDGDGVPDLLAGG